jgi:Ca2+-binding RTX toxin-like protein
MSGGTGQDFYSEGNVASGADTFSCGTGSDGLGDRVQYTEGSLIYDGRTVGVYFSPDNVANDGENTDGNFSNGGEEGDNIHSDCEVLWGGKAGDYFWGGGGNDVIVGMQGDDTLVGNAGNDDLEGREGDDLLFAIDGVADSVSGGNNEEDGGGDQGQWDAGIDTVNTMEDSNPG